MFDFHQEIDAFLEDAAKSGPKDSSIGTTRKGTKHGLPTSCHVHQVIVMIKTHRPVLKKHADNLLPKI